MSQPWPIRKAKRVFERARRLVNHARGRAHRWLDHGPAAYRKETGLRIRTDHPVAYESHDHQMPHGTANDNTHYPWFVAKTQHVFGRKVRHMDLGCSGGGLVKDFLDANHFSVGVEGSDYSLKRQRAEWKTSPVRHRE